MLRFWYTDNNCKDSYLIYLFYFLSNIVSFLRVVISWGSRNWWVFCVCSECHSSMCCYIPIMSVLFFIKKHRLLEKTFWLYPFSMVHCCTKRWLINIKSGWGLQVIFHCRFILSLNIISGIALLFSRLVVSDSATWWTAALQASLSFTVSQSLLKLMSIEFQMVAIRPSHTLLPTSLPALNLSKPQDIYQWVSFLHWVANILELQHHSFQWIFRVDFL